MAGRRRFGRVRQLPSGRWQARYTSPDGRLVSAPYTFERRTDADRWIAGVETDIARGTWLDPGLGEITVGEWGARWLAAARSHLKIKTFAGYESPLKTKINPTFGDKPLTVVRPIMVSEWVANLSASGLSPSRVRQSYRLLSQVMRAAVENGLIAASPCRGVRLPRMPATEPRIVSEEQVARLLAELPAPHHLLVTLLAYGGLRIGEAFALRRRSVDLRGGKLTISESLVEITGYHTFDTPKTHQRRTIALPAFVVDGLSRHLASMPERESRALLFTTRSNGRPLHYNAWRETYFNPAVARAGLSGVTPHDLRASHATWVAERHGIMAAALRLGHAHASVTTRHYARSLDGRDAEVAAALDRGRPGTEGAREGHDAGSAAAAAEGTGP